MTDETKAASTRKRLTQPVLEQAEKRTKTMLRKMILISAFLAMAVPAVADEAHHSDSTAPATPPAAASPMPAGQPGMMSGEMMGPGMMSGGMMGSGMMSMMGPMAQMMAPEHIEGRIAFLRTELRITEAQQPLWDAFADALRANARAMADMMTQMQGSMMPSQTATPDTLLQRIDLHERLLAARLEGLRRMKAALQPLYAALDDTQKRTADELLAPGPMGPM